MKDAAGSLLYHLMDMNNPSEPRMPRVEDIKLLDLMGVISSLCTICGVRIRRSASEHRTRRTLANRRLRRHWCLLLAGGNWFASGREQLVAPRRLVDHKFQVLGKKVALVNQAPSSAVAIGLRMNVVEMFMARGPRWPPP